MSVTRLIKLIPLCDIPELLIDVNQTIPIVRRPRDVNPSMYGYFIEYLVVDALGGSRKDEIERYLTLGDESSSRYKFIRYSYHKKIYDPTDICNFSFCSKLLFGKFYEGHAIKLYNHVKLNIDYYNEYHRLLRCCGEFPKLDPEEQKLCNKISVGSISGVIDMISDNTIIDIKCKSKDNINYYRKQLYSYACLYLIRYGKKIDYCKIYNFLNGNAYYMDVTDLTYDDAVKHVELLRSYC